MACIALFVAQGGTGKATLRLPKKSIKAKQLAPRSVRSSEAVNLTAKDFRATARPKLRGPQGDPGPTGPPGPRGGAGTEALRLAASPSAGTKCDNSSPPPSGEFCEGKGPDRWSNAGNAYSSAGFYTDGSGLAPTGKRDGPGRRVGQAVVFYLPAGYGPAQKLRFPTLTPGDTASIEIGPDGAVAPFTAGGIALTQTSILPLDGIVFRP